MKRACVVETDSGAVVVKSVNGHAKDCVGHVPNITDPADYKYLTKVNGQWVICVQKKSKDMLEILNESISE